MARLARREGKLMEKRIERGRGGGDKKSSGKGIGEEGARREM